MAHRRGQLGIVEYGLTSGYGALAGDSAGGEPLGPPVRARRTRPITPRDVDQRAGLARLGDFTFSTPSNLPGQINFFFNRSVDASLANPDTAQQVDIQAKAIAFINRATYSIDLAGYSFNAPPFTDALIARWNAGIKVRYIIDAGNTQTEANRLRNAGIR